MGPYCDNLKFYIFDAGAPQLGLLFGHFLVIDWNFFEMTEKY